MAYQQGDRVIIVSSGKRATITGAHGVAVDGQTTYDVVTDDGGSGVVREQSVTDETPAEQPPEG